VLVCGIEPGRRVLSPYFTSLFILSDLYIIYVTSIYFMLSLYIQSSVSLIVIKHYLFLIFIKI
jgi:hypothetical protein